MMGTNESQVEKILERYQRELLTKTEAVNSILLALADVGDAREVTSLFNVLSHELKSAVRERLDELQDAAFSWRPFMFGDGLSDTELERLSRELRFVYDTLRPID